MSAPSETRGADASRPAFRLTYKPGIILGATVTWPFMVAALYPR